jgi:hypothetical protein
VVQAIATTHEFIYVVVAGIIKQYLVADHQMVKHYEIEWGIRKIITTLDDKYLFAACNNGFVYQICIKTEDGNEYKIYSGAFQVTRRIAITRDSTILLTVNEDSYVKKIFIQSKKFRTSSRRNLSLRK